MNKVYRLIRYPKFRYHQNSLWYLVILFFIGRIIGLAQQVGAPDEVTEQNFQVSSLASEIRTIESIINTASDNSPASSPSARREAFIRLARLQQLSGDMEAASKSWLNAAAAEPGSDSDIVSGAFCMAAIGEWEKAATIIAPVLKENK